MSRVIAASVRCEVRSEPSQDQILFFHQHSINKNYSAFFGWRISLQIEWRISSQCESKVPCTIECKNSTNQVGSNNLYNNTNCCHARYISTGNFGSIKQCKMIFSCTYNTILRHGIHFERTSFVIKR